MKHRARGALVCVCAGLLLACVGVGGAGAASVKVCPSGCAFSQIAPAISAASPGDTIQVAPASYDGGFTIDKSLKLVGEGAGSTIIEDGGRVITIGVAFAASEPTVTVDGVTVTGGVTLGNLSPDVARGGGIYIPRAAGPSTGATVTIRNSVIGDNRVAPSGAVDSVASAGGGGDLERRDADTRPHAGHRQPGRSSPRADE
jgi:nitrous oxidase accessory protein NosD